MVERPVYEIPVVQPGDSAAGWAPERLVPGGRRAARTEPEPAVMPDLTADLTADLEDEPGPVAGRLWDVTDPASADPVDLGRPAAVDAASAPLDQKAGPAAAGDVLVDEVPVDEAASATADPDLLAALHEVVYQAASDLHLTVNAPPMIRVDGALRPAGSTEPWLRDKVLAALGSLLTSEQHAIFEAELELDFAYTLSANARFRVNYYQQRGSIGGAFRLIPTEIKQLKDLGVPDRIGEFAKLPRGLVLVTGPTGSGKSTTLAALIDLVNRTRADHIVTVEDPIEFLHAHQKSLVNQREVGNDTHSFAAALKHVLRQDPDVILIGELRDLETVSVALTAAETGHLVFATLHTQDAAQTIDRVIDVFPPHQQGQVRSQLAGVLQGVVCQALVKRASGHGRVVATEVLVVTPAIANLIREGKTYQVPSMMQAGRGLGMHTMDQHLAELVGSGRITRAAADEKVHDPETFDRLIERGDSSGAMAERAAAVIDFGDSFSSEVG
jgi:twitching motility protein PilT